MSSGPNIYTPGAKLGSLPQNWGFLNPGSYMSTAQPFPTGAFANWKPAGEAALQGIEAGSELGESLAKLPSQLKQAQLQTQLTGAEAKSAEADAAAKLAQIGWLQYSRQTAAQQATGQPVPGAGPLPISSNVDKILGTSKTPAKAPADIVPNVSASNVPQTPQGTVTVGAPVQTSGNVPNVGAIQGSATGAIQGTNVAEGTTATGNTGGTPIAAGSGTTTLGAGQTPTPTPQQVALGAMGRMQANYAQQNNGQLIQSQVPAPPQNNETSQEPSVVSPDGRKPLIGSDGKPVVVNGIPFYQNDDGRGGAYFYEPMPGGKERRFPTIGSYEEQKNGYEVDNPQQLQILNMREKLQGSAVTPQQVGFPQGQTWADVGNNPGDGMKMSNAMHILASSEDLKPASQATIDDIENSRNELQRGDEVWNAVQKLKPSDYNQVSTTVAGLINKYGSTPGIGDALRALTGQKGLTPEQSQFYRAYDGYLNAARLDTTGKLRSNPEEFKALLGSMGSPTETNWDFKQRFGEALNQKRMSYINRIDDLPAGHETLMPIMKNGQYMTMAQKNNAPGTPEYNTPYDPKTNPYYVPPALQYRDSLYPKVQQYMASKNNPTEVPATQGSQATSQAQPAQTPAIHVKTAADLQGRRVGDNIVINGKQGQVTPALLQKYGLAPTQ